MASAAPLAMPVGMAMARATSPQLEYQGPVPLLKLAELVGA